MNHLTLLAKQLAAGLEVIHFKRESLVRRAAKLDSLENAYKRGIANAMNLDAFGGYNWIGSHAVVSVFCLEDFSEAAVCSKRLACLAGDASLRPAS